MRSKLLIGLSAVAYIALSGWVSVRGAEQNQNQDQDQDSASRIQQGFAIAPVPLNLQGKNRALVGLGSYLVNAVGGCNDCHTNPPYLQGHNPFEGQPKQVNAAHYLAGGMAFGPFISRNLTPENGLPEGHTFDEFLQIMRQGTDFDHAHPQISPLLQVMPWPVYQSMTDRDLRAIYEYLSTIPPATPCAEVSPTAPDPTCRVDQ
jgi:hypothetical protein